MTVKNASDEEKLNALKKYLYVKGDWNDNKPYHYSFSDPLGEKIENKLLSNYLESREGNCVSMPILFLILGNKIGLDATLSNAPNHLFIKYTDKKLGITYNLETTSGAGITRDEWYRKQMPMTDKSIESGIYLRKLSKKESEAVILDSLAEYFMNKNDYARSIAISEIIMKNNVNDISSILRVGSVFYKLMEINYLSKYKSIEQIPTEGREYFNYLAGQNGFWFKKADLLGWVMPKTENEKLYMDLVKRDSKSLMY
jgi:regulator of sirC expression with transglutaminase-like and TPR domain